jgi:signal transduction histidine kinase
MAAMLAAYEATIRQTEQMRTLGQLGGAFAHQLRNSATGARMALDIHREECPLGDRSESLEVGTRQLVLMEKYIQRFLSLGARRSRVLEQLDLVEVIEELLPLLGPTAKHVGVQLDAELPAEAMTIHGERDGLEHLILNLLLNGIEAASEASAAHHREDARVHIAIARTGSVVTLTVEDNGAGPPPEIGESLFESFVTSKPDGVGLGLAIAKQVVTDHHGTIAWRRENGATKFRVELPIASGDALHEDPASEGTVNEGERRGQTARS